MEYNQRFAAKVALVTGAGSGIGRATAIRLAEEGASVYLADINGESLQETTKLLPEGSDYRCGTLDVSSSEACRQLVADTVAEFNRLDVLCNIAGIAPTQHFADISEDAWNRVIGINLNSVFFLCQAAMPHLVESQGNIINMSSSAGRTGQAYNASYGATKAAVLMLSKSLAIEFAAKGVRVNAILPAQVTNPNLEERMAKDPNLKGQFLSGIPAGRMGRPEDIQGLAVLLASDASSWITGALIPMDGGNLALNGGGSAQPPHRPEEA